MSAFDKQIGGSHYVKLKIQPIRFAMVNYWDSAASSTLKYLTRYRDKNGLVDLEKAAHFVDIRESLRNYVGVPMTAIMMGEYCTENGIEGPDAVAHFALESYVLGRVGPETVKAQIENLKKLLQA